MEGPTQFLAVWQSNDRSWLKEVWQSPGFQAFVQTHSELEGKLAKEPNVGGRHQRHPEPGNMGQ